MKNDNLEPKTISAFDKPDPIVETTKRNENAKFVQAIVDNTDRWQIVYRPSEGWLAQKFNGKSFSTHPIDANFATTIMHALGFSHFEIGFQSRRQNPVAQATDKQETQNTNNENSAI